MRSPYLPQTVVFVFWVSLKLFSTVSTASAQNLTSGLVGRYPLDGTGQDLSSQNNPLVMTNVQPTIDRHGNNRGAVYLNGTTSWMVSANDCPINSSQPRTITAWIKSDDFSFYTGNPVIIGLGDKSSERTLFDLSLSPRGGLSWTSANNSGAGAFVHGSWLGAYSESVPIQPNRWIHISVTTSGVLTTTKIYYNGVLAAMGYDDGRAVTSQPYLYSTLQRKIRISTGSPTSGPNNSSAIWWNQGFKGSLDDIRIYNRQLSDAEIAAIYAEPSIATTAPIITTQPQSQALLVGQPLQLSVIASGATPLTYQWLRNGAVLAGATASSYAVGNATATDAGTFSVVVTNAYGSVFSTSATISVSQPVAPAITTQPLATFAVIGGSATFAVEATGTPTPGFQWFKDGSPLSGATNRTLTLNAVSTSNAGTYSVSFPTPWAPPSPRPPRSPSRPSSALRSSPRNPAPRALPLAPR